MDGGTVCDISNEPRSIKIKYICDMDSHKSGTVSECVYTMCMRVIHNTMCKCTMYGYSVYVGYEWISTCKFSLSLSPTTHLPSPPGSFST